MQSKEAQIASLSLGGLQLSDRLIIKFNDETNGQPETTLTTRWGVCKGVVWTGGGGDWGKGDLLC